MFDDDGPRPGHRNTVPRNARGGRVSIPAWPFHADDDLLAACAAGDQQALGALYDRYGSVAYGLALRILGDASLCAGRRARGIRGGLAEAANLEWSRGTASSWVLTMVHRHALDLARSQRGPRRFDASSDLPEAMGSGALLRRERRRRPCTSGGATRGAGAFATLSTAERQVLDLAYWRGLARSGDLKRARDPVRDREEPRVERFSAHLREALGPCARPRRLVRMSHRSSAPSLMPNDQTGRRVASRSAATSVDIRARSVRPGPGRPRGRSPRSRRRPAARASRMGRPRHAEPDRDRHRADRAHRRRNRGRPDASEPRAPVTPASETA